ncbi:unnamed protein product [Urochloa decumbens]|uniref:DUF7595 domain-containing protein n=1 Tax=Urochloa decumbens TaxID=240449 RepID=A0ABC8YMX3_9POAL
MDSNNHPAASSSTKRRRLNRYGLDPEDMEEEDPPSPTTPPPPPPPQTGQHLPLDLQLEVVARSDAAAAIVRFAATSKPLRQAMLGPGFRPRSRVGLIAAVHAGYDPALLLGAPYAPSADDDYLVRASWRLRFDTGQLRSFELASSRGGLLVLWRHEAGAHPELRVCNTFTGHVTSLPYADEEDGKLGNPCIYRPALLAVDDAGRSFELLVMDGCLRACVYSFKDGSGRWGAKRLVKPPPEHNSWCFVKQLMHTSPAVVGRTVYWICSSTAGSLFILAVHADEAQAMAIEPPPLGGYLGLAGSSMGSCTLATTAEGKLGMFVPETEVISMWTLSDEGWSRDVVISKYEINKQVMPGMDANRMICWCVGVIERSRTLIFWMEKVGLIQLNLGTMKANVLPWGGDEHDIAGVFFHEIDMASLL